MSAERRVRVAAMSELSDCEPIAIDVDDAEVLVVRLGDRIYAISNICTHEEVWLDDGDIHPETCEIECPMHEGRFDLRTGEATHEPCVRPVRSYPVHIEGDDVLISVA